MFRILLDKYVLAVQKHRYLKYLRFQKFSISTSLRVMSNFSGEGVQNPKLVMCYVINSRDVQRDSEKGMVLKVKKNIALCGGSMGIF